MDWEESFIDEIIVKKVPGLPEGLNFDALAEKR
jgi:hypothetical protein